MCMLAAMLLLGWLAYRRTSRASVAVATVVLAGTTPWLFELGRVAFEVAMEPLFLVLALLGVERASRLDRWTPSRRSRWRLPSARSRTCTRAGGCSPCSSHSRSRSSRRAAVEMGRHVLGRFRRSRRFRCSSTRAFIRGRCRAATTLTTFVTDDMPPWEIAWRGAVNYLQDLQLWHYVVSGDVKPYAHTPGTSALLAASVMLSVAGLIVILRRYRNDAFWRYAVGALLVSPIPAAATADRFHALRLAPLAVMLAVVAIPSIDRREEALERSRRAQVARCRLSSFSRRSNSACSSIRIARTGRCERDASRLVSRLLAEAWADDGNGVRRLRRPRAADAGPLVRAGSRPRPVTCRTSP